MFVPDGLRTNTYRVLRLSANATLSEIHRAADSMRRTAKLGLAGTNEADIPLLGEVPRSEADIRGAIGRLANPSQRLNDRLFWFHQPPHSRNADAPALANKAISGPPDGATRRHDEALNRLFAAFEAGLDDSGVALWVEALQAWHTAVSDDDYWALVLDLEERGGFEPVALPSDLDALRDDAVRLAADGLTAAGRNALARSDTSTVRRILAAFKELADTGPWTAAVQEDIAFPVVERFRALCRAVREECSSKIAREQDAAERNKSVCDTALKRFRGEIEPALDGVIQILPPDHEAAQQSHEEAALCLSSIATDYTWADGFIASEELHEEALKLAKDTLGAIRIEHGLAQVRDSARKQRVFGALKPISSAPSLSTINGFGFKLYGNSDHDPETQSYATTRYFVALFIPIFPVGRYRVINMGSQYSFLGRLPLRRGDRWHLGIAAVAIVAVILSSVISSNQDSGSSYTPSRSSSYGLNSYVPSAPSTSPERPMDPLDGYVRYVPEAPVTYTLDPPTERPMDPLGGVTELHSPNQRSYDYSHTTQMSSLKARIEAGRSRMSMLEVQLQPVIDELTTLNARMEALASELKSLDRQRNAGIQIDIDDYNAKVDTHNRLLGRHRALIAASSTDLQLYEELVEKDKALVAQHNALLR